LVGGISVTEVEKTISRRWIRSFVAGCILCVLPGIASAQDCSNPPRGWGSNWWSQYEQWCKDCNGIPNKATTSCTPGANWGRKGSIPSSTPGGPSFDWQEWERRRKEQVRQEEEARKRRELMGAEEEAKRKEEEARTKFLQERKETPLKGMEGDALTVKQGSGFFGVKGNPKGEMKIGTGAPEGKSRSAAMAWSCATGIVGYVFPAARKGDAGEVRYLREQAAIAFRGEKPGVECPKIDTPPDIEGAAIGAESPGARFYSRLLEVMVDQTERLAQADREVAKAIGKPDGTEEEIRKLEQERPAPEQGKKDDGTLAAALAALQKAKEIRKKIQDNEALHMEVRTNPSLAEKLLGKIEK
jgi:hypothetical protein